MSQTRLFVARLPWSVGKDALKQYFGKFGQVADTHVVMDRATGRSKGYGFVTFEDASVAQEVLKQPHSLEGRQLALNPAKDDTPRAPRAPRESQRFFDDAADSGAAPSGQQ